MIENETSNLRAQFELPMTTFWSKIGRDVIQRRHQIPSDFSYFCESFIPTSHMQTSEFWCSHDFRFRSWVGILKFDK